MYDAFVFIMFVTLYTSTMWLLTIAANGPYTKKTFSHDLMLSVVAFSALVFFLDKGY